MSSLTNTSNEHTSKQTCANWSILKPDLLYFISKKLCDISDFIIFRAVCKAWRNATDLSDPPPQFPCLLKWPCKRGSSLCIYSPASQRTHTFHIPNTSFYGPAGQDIVVKSHSDFHLSYLNPFTKVKESISYGETFRHLKLDYVGFSSRIEQFVMVRYLTRYDVFYFKRSAKDHWTSMKRKDLRSAAYYKNRYFLLEKHNADYRIVIIDENGKLEVSSIPFPIKGLCYNFVITTTDRLLAVGASLDESQFEVHRLDNYPQNPHWIKLSGIGDLMLFVDHCSCFSLNASDYSGFKGNSIYFFNRYPINSEYGKKHMIRRFDMDLNKVEQLSGSPSWFIKPTSAVQAAWFVPSMLCAV